MKFKVFKKGSNPPQQKLPNFRNNEEMLLFVAWVHGLEKKDIVHRLLLFSLIQSHIDNKSEEALQALIERSSNWNKHGRGKYSLSDKGFNFITENFGQNTQKLNLEASYKFYRNFKNRTFSALVNPSNGKIKIEIDGDKINGTNAVQSLKSLDAYFKVKSSSSTRKVLNWIIQNGKYRWERLGNNFSSESLVISDLENGQNIAEEDDEEAFPEGKEIFRLHKTRERNNKVIELAKKLGKKKDPNLKCQVCGFSFIEQYGKIGEGFIEAHHTLPLSELNKESETKIEDIALICSNCHRMLHRKRPWLTMKELKNLIQS